MGHGKETPRQKMIGMMYLVLLALLAMNVSAEILNAFVLVDNSLGKSEVSANEKNKEVLSAFVTAYELNPKAVEEWKKKADDTHTSADELIAQIIELQKEIVAAGDGTSDMYENGTEEHAKGAASIKKKDSQDEGTRILIEDGKGAELKLKVEALRAEFISSIEGLKGADGIVKSLNEVLNTDNVTGETGDDLSWEHANFSQMPLVATITMLTKLKSDVRNAEGEVLKYLKTRIGANDIKFNKIEAIVQIDKPLILQGESSEARIFIAAYDSTVTPDITVGGRAIKVEKGTGIYTLGGGPGEHPFKGMIKMLNPNTGDTLKYDFESTYSVAVPSVSVSPTKMNVFYIGVDNPVDVTAAGVNPNDVAVSISGGASIRKSGEGYNVRVKSTKGVTVNVTAKGKSLGSKKFRCKRVPDPVAVIGAGKNKKGGIMPKNQLPKMSIKAELENFDFNLKFNVVSHTVIATIKGFEESAKGNGSRFNGKQKQIMAQVKRGKRVIIEDIRAKGPDGSVRRLGSLVFKLK